jgi:SAM-dependent methyltransferase
MTQADFWSNNPCGVDGELSQVIGQRYRVEPWLPRELRTIPVGLGKYLEVGCGQGVDSFYICARLYTDDAYTAIDYSEESVKRAGDYVGEADAIFGLKVTPQFSRGDALNLDLQEDTFDFVYSMGVIHHTPNPQQGIDEVWRVLKPGGRTKIFLYRRNSLKVGVAKFLRLLQWISDKVLFQDRIIYKLMSKTKKGFFGSMFLECFGVPWMAWFTQGELRTMFGKFSSVEIQPYGFNLPKLSGKEIGGYNQFGYFYMIDATK